MVDPKKQAAADRAKIRRTEKAADLYRFRIECHEKVIKELDALFGPFADTELGAQDRTWACQRAYGGKTPGDLVKEMMLRGSI